MADIKSVASEHTWGTFNTAEDTVVANNVRTPKKEPGKKTPQQLSGGSASHSTVRAFSPTESYSVSSSKDSSSLFDLGSIDSSTYSQYASGSSLSKKMKEAVASVGGGGMSNNSDNVDCNEASGITSWMNYFTCGDSSEMLSEEREGRTGDGRYNNMVDGGRQESPKNRQNHGSPISTPEDALLLQKALRDSTSTPRSRKPRNTANIGSLDIVMELQQQEHTTPKAGLKTRLRNLSVGRRRTIDGDVSSRPKSISKSSRELSQGTASTKSSKRKGLKKSCESSKADLLLADDRTDIGAIRIVQSKSSDHSVFDFEKEENKSKKPPMKSKRVNWINGPALGTYLNVSTAANAVHPELAHTYSTFRADKPSIDMVLSRVKCSVPLYHQTDTNKHAQLLMSMSSESEESAKLPIDVKHVCSEPVATTFDVRSQSYLADGQKQHSEESMFALLGTDSLLKNEVQGYRASDVSKISSSYFNRLKTATKRLGLDTPFLIIVNFVVPWGNLLAYFYRPDGVNGRPFNAKRKRIPAEKLWDDFLRGNEAFRNSTLKFIPRVVEGPWAVRKMVGTQPAMIGQKIPTSYHGSLEEGYLEICMNVTKGGKMANGICSAVASKASNVSIDLAFLLQGGNDRELPEQLLSVVRLHHVRLKKSVV